MRGSALVTTGLLALAALSIAATAKQNDRLVVFATEAEVDVDSNGKVIAVKPDASLSPAIGRAIQNDVGQWRFSAPTKGGIAVGGTTYVQLDACAEPTDGKYRFVVKYRGNGPGSVGPLMPPPYPREALRYGTSATLKITYRILPDGRAQIEDVVFLEGGKQFEKSFRSAAKSMIEQSKFRPERVDGEAVSTRESFVLTFGVDIAKYRQAENERLTECQAALTARDGDDGQVALDSPFHLIPAN